MPRPTAARRSPRLLIDIRDRPRPPTAVSPSHSTSPLCGCCASARSAPMLMAALYHFGADMKRPVNAVRPISRSMAYDPGALNASLAAAVGNDGALMAELKVAFVESAARQLDLLGRSRCDANWQIAAARLKSIAASFGAAGLIELADEALDRRPRRPGGAAQDRRRARRIRRRPEPNRFASARRRASTVRRRAEGIKWRLRR